MVLAAPHACRLMPPRGVAAVIESARIGYSANYLSRTRANPGTPCFEAPLTIASAIRIGKPASWDLALAAASESEGAIMAVTDRDILAAYVRVAREGLFAEPASAASVAGLLRLSSEGRLQRGSTVVCVLTGHGLKDPEWAITGAAEAVTVPADVDAVAAELGL